MVVLFAAESSDQVGTSYRPLWAGEGSDEQQIQQTASIIFISLQQTSFTDSEANAVT